MLQAHISWECDVLEHWNWNTWLFGFLLEMTYKLDSYSDDKGWFVCGRFPEFAKVRFPWFKGGHPLHCWLNCQGSPHLSSIHIVTNLLRLLKKGRKNAQMLRRRVQRPVFNRDWWSVFFIKRRVFSSKDKNKKNTSQLLFAPHSNLHQPLSSILQRHLNATEMELFSPTCSHRWTSDARS